MGDMAMCPFDKSAQLTTESVSLAGTLPGYPRIDLSDRDIVDAFLYEQLFAEILEGMAPKLWWMAKQDSKSISPLHRQIIRSRRVVVTEDPKLHLVWFNDRIFIKPLPAYLLSHEFWIAYLSSPQTKQQVRIRKAAMGFLRTYFYLIQHPSDFRIATEKSCQLISEDITYARFCHFSRRLNAISDKDVTWRYSYGEIRLSRLNFYVKIFAGRWSYHRTELQYGAYFARFYGPFLFVFGFFSVVLSAVQAEAAVEQIGMVMPWFEFQTFARGFSIFTLTVVLLIFLTFATLWMYKFVKEWRFALVDRFGRKRIDHESRRHELRAETESKALARAGDHSV